MSQPDQQGLLMRILGSPVSKTIGTIGLPLMSAWGCLFYLGVALVGPGGLSATQTVLLPLLPVAVASLVFGGLCAERWRVMVGVSLVPVLFLGALVVAGAAEQGERVHGAPLVFLVGMAGSIVGLGFLGSRIRGRMSARHLTT